MKRILCAILAGVIVSTSAVSVSAAQLPATEITSSVGTYSAPVSDENTERMLLSNYLQQTIQQQYPGSRYDIKKMFRYDLANKYATELLESDASAQELHMARLMLKNAFEGLEGFSGDLNALGNIKAQYEEFLKRDSIKNKINYEEYETLVSDIYATYYFPESEDYIEELIYHITDVMNGEAEPLDFYEQQRSNLRSLINYISDEYDPTCNCTAESSANFSTAFSMACERVDQPNPTSATNSYYGSAYYFYLANYALSVAFDELEPSFSNGCLGSLLTQLQNYINTLSAQGSSEKLSDARQVYSYAQNIYNNSKSILLTNEAEGEISKTLSDNSMTMQQALAELQEALDYVDDNLPIGGAWTTASFNRFSEAKSVANSLLYDSSATPSQIIDAKNELLDAFNSLEAFHGDKDTLWSLIEELNAYIDSIGNSDPDLCERYSVLLNHVLPDYYYAGDQETIDYWTARLQRVLHQGEDPLKEHDELRQQILQKIDECNQAIKDRGKNYSNDSWDNYKSAVKWAVYDVENILSKMDQLSEDIDKVQNAFDALVVKSTDRTFLKSQMNDILAERKNETKGSERYNALTNIYNEANNVYKNEHSQKEFDEMSQRIDDFYGITREDAKNMLQQSYDFAISNWPSEEDGPYTEESMNKLITYKESAERQLKSSTVTQIAMRKTEFRLMKALRSIEIVVGDKTQLRELTNQLYDYKEVVSVKVGSRYNSLCSLYEEAETVLANARLQEDIDAMTARVSEAITPTHELGSIEIAEALDYVDRFYPVGSCFTTESLDRLSNAKYAAQHIGSNATGEECREIRDELIAAFNGLTVFTGDKEQLWELMCEIENEMNTLDENSQRYKTLHDAYNRALPVYYYAGDQQEINEMIAELTGILYNTGAPGQSRIKRGDADGDNEVSISDVTEIQKHLCSLGTLKANGIKAADVDGDESVTIQDATLIQYYLAFLGDGNSIGEYF
ncbi:MAG: dockerin type I domain-containing protein [Ruminococcus sp.]|nr:dockerin type I domain-containing protein [Ruminococcus sp.]